ncbi:MAG: DNA polymerase III subunit alpha [Phycisphaerae bacterium]|nr:DNA polymerase III subunit alpha [Phycisphaerae bacterium]
MPEHPEPKVRLHPAKSPQGSGLPSKTWATPSAFGLSRRRRDPCHPVGDKRALRDVRYAELHCRSNFSFLRGASHPEELCERAAELGYAALAIADRHTLAGAVRMHVAAKTHGIRPLVGAEIVPVDASAVLLFPTDRSAYGRLSRLLTRGCRRMPKGECRITREDVESLAEGLVAVVLPDFRRAEFGDDLLRYRGVFGDRLYLAAEAHRTADAQSRLARLSECARRHRVPLVAANDVHYHVPQRRYLQDVLTCIREHCTLAEAGRRLWANAERHLRSLDEIGRLYAGLPGALERTLEIADRCRFSLDELRYEYPEEVCPSGLSPIQFLREQTWAGAAVRFGGAVPLRVKAMLEHELGLIESLGYASYFLTVWDLVRFARSRGILCQGRGSAANSAVCYCLGITAVDPDRIDVLFERFISRERNEPPDIDVDFEHERREEVFQYIYRKYGRERAGITAEVITYRSRSAVRDVGKALGLSPDRVDVLAKKLDFWSHNGLDEARLREAGLDPADYTVRCLTGLVRQLIGFPRHLSQHVGGFVITRGALCELVPIENAAMPDRTFIQWDKDDIDALGILKVDCLALGMLTCLRKCFAMINAQQADAERLVYPDTGGARRHVGTSGARRPSGEIVEQVISRSVERNAGAGKSATGRQLRTALSLETLPAEDPAVYAMLCRADSVGVFQVESRAQMSMLPRLRPRCFYDLVIEVAIVRPGPIQGGMVHPYLRRRNGEEPIDYPNAALQAVLGKTLGVPLFQEQAMRLAMVAAGFTAGEADRLRRAMAAWRRHGEIEQFRHRLIDGMLANGLSREFAERSFEQIRGFGEYGFPESHAASFALLVYASAWLKRYYPAAYAAALINSQPMGFYAPAQIVQDAQRHGVAVLPIDVNHSAYDCLLEDVRSGKAEDQTANGREWTRMGEAGGKSAEDRTTEAQRKENEPRHEDTKTEAEGRDRIQCSGRRLAGRFCGEVPLPDQTRPAGRRPLRVAGHRSAEFHPRDPTQEESGVRRQKAEEELTAKTPRAPRREGEPQRHEGTKNKAEAGDGTVLRLGMRLVQGISRRSVAGIEAARRDGPFRSVAELVRRAGISRTVAARLAAADAFSSMGLDRRQALWDVLALREELPLWAGVDESEPATELPAMSIGQQVLADYKATGLSLTAHPVALFRQELASQRVIQAAQLRRCPQGRFVRVAGLVLVRQRPSTAGGIVFATLEDETGVANLILRPRIYERFRSMMGACVWLAEGRVERQGDVIHVQTTRIEDLGHRLSALRVTSRDFH